MIRLENLTKSYFLKGVEKKVARNINFEFPTGKSVALIGRNGAGKSSLLNMLSGVMDPDGGRIIHSGTVSWPVGFKGSFHRDLSGAQNVRFVGRVYGVDTDELVHFVEDFAELGQHFHLPFRSYSAGMRSRLAFGLSMGIHFDTYLVDEVTSVGDATFRKKCNLVFKERRKTSGAIVVSHSVPTLKNLCDSGALLDDGHLTYYPKLADALAAYDKLVG